MEQNLEKTCKESDRVLRYVRRRFVSEMDTRRRLAEERREVIRQQCSRYQVILAIGDERMPEVLSIMKDHIVELSLLNASFLPLTPFFILSEKGDVRIKINCNISINI